MLQHVQEIAIYDFILLSKESLNVLSGSSHQLIHNSLRVGQWHNVTVLGHVAFYQISKFLVNILFLSLLTNFFAAQMKWFLAWPAGYSLETCSKQTIHHTKYLIPI